MEPYSAIKGKDGSAEPTRDENEISVLCFNVFAGSPLPFYHCGGTALQDSERLRLQVEHIRQVQPDIIALQEVCSDSVARAYREAFKDMYDSYYDFLAPSITAVASLVLLYTILASILSLAFHSVLVHVLGFWQPPVSTEQLTGGIMLFSAVFLKCLVLVAIVMRRSAVTGFLSGSVKGSNMVLWRRSRFSVAYEKKHGGALVPCDMYTTLFKEQQGDYLNLFRPRGYLSVRLFFNGTVPLWVVNVHLNLGTKDFRRRQVDELRTHCEALSPTGSVLLVGDMNATPDSEEICLLTQEGGFRDALSEHGCGMQPTWAARNPLTQGVLIEDDHRCDYIFYRPMVGCHEVENRSCRIVMDSQPWLSDHFGLLMDLSLRSLAPSQNVPVELVRPFLRGSATVPVALGASA